MSVMYGSVICKCDNSSSNSLVSTIIYVYFNNFIDRGPYMSTYVLLNLLNELEKEIKCEECLAFYLFFATSLIKSIIREHEC